MRLRKIEEAYFKGDTRTTFRLIDKMTKVRGDVPIVKSVIKDGLTVSDPYEVCKAAAAYFKQILYDPALEGNQVNETSERPEMFSLEEIVAAIKDCDFKKGLGPDMFDGQSLLDEEILANVG